MYKGAKHGLAVLDEYLSYEMFGTVINFTDQTGTKFRVYHGENPILIPYANDLEAKSETAGKGLARAMESAPHLRRKLDVIKQAWLNRNAFEKAGKQKQASLTKPKSVTSPPLKTKSGEEFREWSISRIEGKKAVIQHADGSTSVLIADILSETLWQDPVVKKAINEGTEKEAKGDLLDALAIFTQFELKEAISRVLEKLAHEKEANGDLKAARDFYSQINSGKDVARLTAQIDEQEQKMRAETKAREIQQDQLDRKFGGTLLQVNPIESQAAQFANMQAMQISAAKSGYHFNIPSLTRLKEMDKNAAIEILGNIDQGPVLVDALLALQHGNLDDAGAKSVENLLDQLQSGACMSADQRMDVMVELRSNLQGRGVAQGRGIAGVEAGANALNNDSKVRCATIIRGIDRGYNTKGLSTNKEGESGDFSIKGGRD